MRALAYILRGDPGRLGTRYCGVARRYGLDCTPLFIESEIYVVRSYTGYLCTDLGRPCYGAHDHSTEWRVGTLMRYRLDNDGL